MVEITVQVSVCVQCVVKQGGVYIKWKSIWSRKLIISVIQVDPTKRVVVMQILYFVKQTWFICILHSSKSLSYAHIQGVYYRFTTSSYSL